jgi:hypothetical protein
MAATAAANPFPYWQPGAVTGIDFTKQFPNIAYKYQPTGGLIAPPAPVGTYDTGSALPSSADTAKYYKEVLKELYPLQLQQTLDAAKIQQQMNEQGFASAYPWITQAANEATARNLRASEAYRSFAESQPSSVQNIMASKQQQMATAASSEADRARAMAAQQQAAKEFAGRYSGQTFSVG